MIITPTLVRSESGAGPTGFNRLLLQCRYDYQQRAWNLPTFESHRDRDLHSVVDSVALAAASKIFLKLSRHSEVPLKTATRSTPPAAFDVPITGQTTNTKDTGNLMRHSISQFFHLHNTALLASIVSTQRSRYADSRFSRLSAR
jgi:hypothetical protein